MGYSRVPLLSRLCLPPSDTQRSVGRKMLIILARDMTLVPRMSSVYCDPGEPTRVQLGSCWCSFAQL